MTRRCQVLRVFTRGDAGGNALGVMDDVTGLDGSRMQDIATQLGFSETVFIEWREPDVPFVRIFTPAIELPFAGHPLVGTAWAIRMLGSEDVDRLRCGIGEVRCRVDAGMAWIDVPVGGTVEDAPDANDVAAAAGLSEPLRSALVLLPKDYLLLEVAEPAQVSAAQPDVHAFADRFGVYLFARREDEVKARFFAPGAGVPEDPATGSAAVALATALIARGESAGSARIEQGDEIGHPSTIHLEWNPETVSIGGTVVRDEVRSLDV